MRADRLVATLLLMQARGRVTAAEVAAELEVSVATARRDLEALSAAGIPVYPQPGRGGGWSLVGGARTDLTGLTATEARALFLLAGPAASVEPPARSALRKLVRALPDTFRADAEAAADAVVVDSARWGERDRARPERDRHAPGRRHPSAQGRAGVREPRPPADASAWSTRGGSSTRTTSGTSSPEPTKGQRTFRVDRIIEATVTDAVAERPTDFDLPREWERVVDEVEQRRSLLSATVLIATHLLPVLRQQFGRHCEPLETRDDGRVRVRVAAPMAVSIAEQIAGWGATVEVLEPDSVKVELGRIGSELVQRYAPR